MSLSRNVRQNQIQFSGVADNGTRLREGRSITIGFMPGLIVTPVVRPSWTEQIDALQDGRFAHGSPGRPALFLAGLAGQDRDTAGLSSPAIEEKLELVASGWGIVILPESATRYYTRPDVTYRRVADLPETQVCLAVVSSRRSAVLREFIELARTLPTLKTRFLKRKRRSHVPHVRNPCRGDRRHQRHRPSRGGRRGRGRRAGHRRLRFVPIRRARARPGAGRHWTDGRRHLRFHHPHQRRRRLPGGAGRLPGSAIGGAIISAGRSLAAAPVRVNVVAPGVVRTQLCARIPEEIREQVLAHAGSETLAVRIDDEYGRHRDCDGSVRILFRAGKPGGLTVSEECFA
jgi:hypothetical protein